MIGKHETMNFTYLGPNIAAITKCTIRNISLCFSQTKLKWLKFKVPYFHCRPLGTTIIKHFVSTKRPKELNAQNYSTFF